MLASVTSSDRLTRTPYRPYGTAIYRRAVTVEVEEGYAVGELIDDFHHFRAVVHHDGARVTNVSGEALRYPWATCAGSTEPLRRLVGTPLEPSLRGPGRHTSARTQCTHLFDAAALAIARLARGAGSVAYAMAIPDRMDGRTRAEIARDGEALFAWELEAGDVVGPSLWVGSHPRVGSDYREGSGPRVGSDRGPRRSLGGGFADWVESEFDAATAEAAMLLQRACIISSGRSIDLEARERADSAPPHPMGVCHTFTPGIVEGSFRMVGSIRNLTDAKDLRAASLDEGD